MLEPTRITDSTASVLDLILTTAPDLISPVTYLPGISDHSTLHFNLRTTVRVSPKTVRHYYDYNKANFDLINNKLAEYLDMFLDNFDQRSVDENWNMFKNKVNSLIALFIPVRTITSNPTSP